jgi:hypothetical protein
LFFTRALNSSSVIQRYFAYFFILSLHIAILVFISFITFETAVPQASASTPIDSKAAAIQRISDSDIHTSDILAAAAAILCEKFVISFSVVAILFHSLTIVDHHLSMLDISILVTLANCAANVAASSLVRFVETANLSITSVNSAKWSVVTHN